MKSYRIALVLLAAALTAVGCTQKDPTEKKIDELLSKMTLREKIGQMNQISVNDAESCAESARKGEIGSVLNLVDPVQINKLQKAAVEESRLGIPILVSRDVIHGFKTVLPLPIGQAATFDPALIEKGARVAADEATACGVRWTFSPMLDIARDIRWGRLAEGYGEDPYLDTQMGLATVRGYQEATTPLAACIKHFVGYGATEGGRDYNSTTITERQLRNIYFPAFKASADEGAMTLMTSFNANDGIPSTGNKWLVDDVLKGEWNFDGFVVTDWNSAGEMVTHGYATDLKDAARLAADAGVDMDMMSYGFITYIENLVAEKKLSEARIDDAVRRILRVKFSLGLFDNPYVDEHGWEKALYTSENLAVAQQTAEESAILLKNEDDVLPLKAGSRILVTGPLADSPYEQLGTWAFDGDSTHTVTPLPALREKFSVTYIPSLEYCRDENTSSFGRVRAAAASADAVVVFVGEEAIMSGEAHCLVDPSLKGAQSELIATAHASGKPVVVVVMAGRPLIIGKDLENCDAMLYMFHPGTMGGPAIARLLDGEVSPSGKTPMTFPEAVGQTPIYYNHENTGRPNTGTETLLSDLPRAAGQTSNGCTSYYLDAGYGPLFPFGYGLSYGKFEYSNVSVEKNSLGMADTLKVSYTLTNVGKHDATEVAQLYVRDMVGSVVHPVRELKRFERISVGAGESVECSFSLPVSELAFWNADMDYVVEPGEFQLWVSGDSASGTPLPFSIR